MTSHFFPLIYSFSCAGTRLKRTNQYRPIGGVAFISLSFNFLSVLSEFFLLIQNIQKKIIVTLAFAFVLNHFETWRATRWILLISWERLIIASSCVCDIWIAVNALNWLLLLLLKSVTLMMYIMKILRLIWLILQLSWTMNRRRSSRVMWWRVSLWWW